jgi:hypothetical protein
MLFLTVILYLGLYQYLKMEITRSSIQMSNNSFESENQMDSNWCYTNAREHRRSKQEWFLLLSYYVSLRSEFRVLMLLFVGWLICLVYVICVCLRMVVSNTYCVVFLLCFSSSCVSLG